MTWNKGLTKESDPRVAAYGKAVSRTKKGNPKYGKIGIKNLQNDQSLYSIKLEGKVDLEELKAFYWKYELNQRQLAKIYGCSQGAISMFMKRHGIFNRGKGDGVKWIDPKRKEEGYKILSEELKGNKNWIFGLHRRNGFPNKDERKLIRIFKENNIPLKFVGNGTFFIEGKNPDFVNVERKKVLEYDCVFWHESRPDGYDEIRNEIYRRNGWDLFIITDGDLKGWRGNLIDKIKNWFNHNAFNLP